MRSTRRYPGTMLFLVLALTACEGVEAEEANLAVAEAKSEAPDPIVQQLRGSWTLVVGMSSLDVMLRDDGAATIGENEYRYSVNSGAQPVEMDLTPANPDQLAERWIVEVVTPTKVRVAMAAKSDEPRPMTFKADGPMLFKDPTEAMAAIDRRKEDALVYRMPRF